MLLVGFLSWRSCLLPLSKFLENLRSLFDLSIPNDWTLESLFTNQNQLGAGTCSILEANMEILMLFRNPLNQGPIIHFSQTGQILHQKFCGWVGVPITPLGFLFSYRKQIIQVSCPQCCESHTAKALTKILGHLPSPWSLSHLGDVPYLSTPVSYRFLFIFMVIYPSSSPPHTTS